MKNDSDLMTKAKETTSAEALLHLAQENGIELTPEEAERYYEQLHTATAELSDNELDNVSGGGCKKKNKDYQVGDHVLFYFRCNYLDGVIRNETWSRDKFYIAFNGVAEWVNRDNIIRRL